MLAFVESKYYNNNNAPNKKETFMSNLLSTKIIVVSILVPVYNHEHRVNHYTYSTCIIWCIYIYNKIHTIIYKQNKPAI